MPRTSIQNLVAAAVARPRGRPRKNPLPVPAARFAPIRLADALGTRHGAAPFDCAFELLFPDGSALRVAHDADPIVLERLVRHLRGRGE